MITIYILLKSKYVRRTLRTQNGDNRNLSGLSGRFRKNRALPERPEQLRLSMVSIIILQFCFVCFSYILNLKQTEFTCTCSHIQSHGIFASLNFEIYQMKFLNGSLEERMTTKPKDIPLLYLVSIKMNFLNKELSKIAENREKKTSQDDNLTTKRNTFMYQIYEI